MKNTVQQRGVKESEIKEGFFLKAFRNGLGKLGIDIGNGEVIPLGLAYPTLGTHGILASQSILALEMSYLYSDIPLQVGCTVSPIYITYIDAVNGNDSWDGSMPEYSSGVSGPKKTANISSWTGTKTSWYSDEILLFRSGNNQYNRDKITHKVGDITYELSCGQEHILTSNLGITTRKHIGAYRLTGDDPRKRPVIRSTVDSGARGAGVRSVIYASGTLSQISISDLIIDCKDVANRNGIMFFQTANDQTINNISINNVAVTGGRINDSYQYTGIGMTYSGEYARLAAYGVSKQILIANCQAVKFPGHGFGMYGTLGERLPNGKWHGVDYVGCLSIGCGFDMDCHAFTSFSGGVKLDWNSSGGWVNTGGTIYWQSTSSRYGRDLPDIEAVYCQLTLNGEVVQLVKNTETPTTPGIGEFGFDVGTSGNQKLYVNINAVVNGSQYFSTCVRPIRGIRYLRCLALDTKNAGVTFPKLEGHGFAFDDFTSNSSVIESHSALNEGVGITLNRGNNIDVICCDVRDNDLSPIKSNFGWGHLISKSRFQGKGYSSTFPGFKGFIHFASASNKSLSHLSPVSVFSDSELRYRGEDTDTYLVLGAFGNSPMLFLRNCDTDSGNGKLLAGRVISQGFEKGMSPPVINRALGFS